MSNKVARINDIGIKEGDIVRIKWKPLEEIINFFKAERHTPSEFLQSTSLDYHLSAIVNDGHYLVDEVRAGTDEKHLPQTKAQRRLNSNQQPDEVTIVNHNNYDGGEFTFNENFIEEIAVEHDAAEHYFSDKFNLSLMKIDGGLFINGKMLTKRDGKLIDILESTISDLAIQKMLEESEKEG
jgi:hypothetical protein